MQPLHRVFPVKSWLIFCSAVLTPPPQFSQLREDASRNEPPGDGADVTGSVTGLVGAQASVFSGGRSTGERFTGSLIVPSGGMRGSTLLR